MIKAVIFDFDGVVVDTETAKFKELQRLLKGTGCVLKKKDFKDMIGRKTGAFLSAKFPHLDNVKINQIVALRRKRQLAGAQGKLIPGIKTLLTFLKSKKIKIALATGSTREVIKKILKEKKIQNFFDIITTGEDFKESKPSPESYKTTLKKLKMRPSEVIVIEDAPAGIKAAKKAGCKTWGITTYLDKAALRKADAIFSGHKAILRYIKKPHIKLWQNKKKNKG